MESDGRRRSWQATKILPLFHGNHKEICHSICESGHTFFGKTSLSKNPGDPQSTDDGYFGSGIYFTNSARYASDIYSGGHLLISWISMREPFPFVGDPKQEDMTKLRGKGAYKHYNAHYAPVSSFDPTDPHCSEYHPTQKGQVPTYDEYVVFHKTQTLPRFWIHLAVDTFFLKTISSQPEHVEDLISHIMTILQNPYVDSDKKVRNYLNEKLTYLLHQPANDYLEEHELSTFYEKLQTLLDGSGKVNRRVAIALIKGSTTNLPRQAAAAAEMPPKQPTKYEADLSQVLAESLKTTPKPAKPVAQKAPLIPAEAFGALKWEQYLGVKVEEPALPPDIQKILTSSCPFWEGKTVQETHVLVLIPKTINSAPLTLNSLGELVKQPKQGHKTHYDLDYCWNKIFKTLGDEPLTQSSWVLMTKDVLPNSRSKSYGDQCKLVESYSQKTKVPYQVPAILEVATCIFLDYVQTGKHLYSREPCTYIRCQEKLQGYQLAVGGFAAGGLHVFSNDVDIGVACLRKF